MPAYKNGLFKGIGKLYYACIESFGFRYNIALTFLSQVISHTVAPRTLYYYLSLFSPKFILPIVNVDSISIDRTYAGIILHLLSLGIAATYFILKRANDYARLFYGVVYAPDEYAYCKSEIYEFIFSNDVSIFVLHGKDIFMDVEFPFTNYLKSNNTIRILVAEPEIAVQRAEVLFKNDPEHWKTYLETKHSNRLALSNSSDDYLSLIKNIWLETSIKINEEFHSLQNQYKNMSHRHYGFLPMWRLFIFPDRVFVQSYLKDKDSVNTPMRVYKKDSPQFEPFANFFNLAWDRFSHE